MSFGTSSGLFFDVCVFLFSWAVFSMLLLFILEDTFDCSLRFRFFVICYDCFIFCWKICWILPRFLGLFLIVICFLIFSGCCRIFEDCLEYFDLLDF